MKTKRAIQFGLLLVGAALIYTLVLYPSLPDRIPIHWNIRGEVDGWGDKRWAAWLMPGTMALFVALLKILPAISPHHFEIEPFAPTFNYLMLVCTALMSYIHIVMLQAALHPTLDMGRVLVGGLFLFFALEPIPIGPLVGR